MSFLETVEKARAFLERNQRVSLRALQREFAIDDQALDALVDELVDIQRVAVRDGSALARIDAAPPAAAGPMSQRVPRYATPKHLAERILTSRSALEGERKQVTVLFVDIKGSMDLQENIDPEQWHRIMDRFFQILTNGVHRFEGTINQYTGDGIMALFGAPIAHEDHAQRACYTALHLQQEVQRYAQDLKRETGLAFSVRMGLNSGAVVVGKIGDDLRMDYTAQGHTVGLAARVQQLAEPGRVYLAEPTARRIEGFFRSDDLGRFKVSGASEPVRVFELVGTGRLRTHLDLARVRGLSRFVGRADEMATLEAGLERARAGNGQIIGVVAEAGAGKSRICFEFLENARARGARVYEARGVSHGKMIPFLPVLELFRSICSITEQDTAETTRNKIAGQLVRVDPSLVVSLPAVFDFLGVPDPQRPSPQTDPEERQRRLFEVAKRAIRALGGAEAAVVLIEDLHWIDGGSEGFLEQLCEAVDGSQTLLLVNFRPEYHADWMQAATYERLPLLPLGTNAIRELLTDLLGSDASVASLPDAIHERTQGNPFFTEEVVRSLVESGQLEGTPGSYRLAEPFAQLGVPDTVQAVLAARIDRLPEREKQVLQTAAVVGKQFERRLLRELAGLPDPELAAALSELASAEFVYEHALYPEPEYAFKHPLTQEVAYASLLGERRASLHGAAARAIEEVHGDQPSAAAGLLSHHWEGAGKPLAAARWNQRAAEWAGFSDPAEAVRHWRKVRELASRAGDSEEARRLGVEACVWILRFSWRIGWDLEEMAAVFREGRELAEQLDDKRSVARLCSAYGGSKAVALEPAGEALALIDEAREIAREIDDPKFTLRLAPDWAVAYGHVGRLGESHRFHEELIEQVRSDPRLAALIHRSRAYMYLLCSGSYALLRQGRIPESVEMAEEACQLARARNAVDVLGWAQATLARCRAAFGDSEGALHPAHEAVEAAERVGGYIRGAAYHALAEAHATAGDWKRAREASELALSFDKRGSWYATSLNTLTEICIETADHDRATELIAEARALGLPPGQGTEPDARLAQARLLLRTEGRAAADRVEATLAELRDACEALGARLLLPRIDLEAAELGRLRGDDDARERALRKAQHSFSEIGATGHAERIAKELEL